jgi:hypothetical protein
MAWVYDWLMDSLFGKEMTIEERIKAMQATLTDSKNNLNKEIRRTEYAKKILGEKIRHKCSERIDEKQLKVMGLRFVKLGNQIVKLENTVDKLDGLNNLMTDIRIHSESSKAFTDLVRCITMINKNTDIYQIESIIKRYEYEKTKMDLVQETLEEHINDANGEEDEIEAEAGNILQQVFEELNIETDGQMPLAPKTAQKTESKKHVVTKADTKQAEAETEDGEDDLSIRIKNLK